MHDDKKHQSMCRKDNIAGSFLLVHYILGGKGIELDGRIRYDSDRDSWAWIRRKQESWRGGTMRICPEQGYWLYSITVPASSRCGSKKDANDRARYRREGQRYVRDIYAFIENR